MRFIYYLKIIFEFFNQKFLLSTNYTKIELIIFMRWIYWMSIKNWIRKQILNMFSNNWNKLRRFSQIFVKFETIQYLWLDHRVMLNESRSFYKKKAFFETHRLLRNDCSFQISIKIWNNFKNDCFNIFNFFDKNLRRISLRLE